jgi:hypothetical protein
MRITRASGPGGHESASADDRSRRSTEVRSDESYATTGAVARTPALKLGVASEGIVRPGCEPS